METIQKNAAITVGSLAPAFELPDDRGQTVSPSTLIGRPVVLFFFGDDDNSNGSTEVIAFRDAQHEFQELSVHVVGVASGHQASHRADLDRNNIAFPLLTDDGAKLKSALDGKSILIGPDWRIVRVYDTLKSADHPREVLADVKRLIYPEPPRAVHQHAPVLLIPNVLPPEFCQRLMQIWETEGNQESGFMKQVEGKTVGMTDYSHKIRRDHFLSKNSPTTAELKHFIGERVLGDMRKAFNYQVTRFEDFRIACYDSSRGGYFRPHRDNTTSGTAHRRFAMSLLLNEDYEGGWLRFPEYGLNKYRPAAGGAVIFSCSLLHEATDITAGRRFVLLSFLFGEKEAKEREAYERSIGGTYRA